MTRAFGGWRRAEWRGARGKRRGVLWSRRVIHVQKHLGGFRARGQLYNGGHDGEFVQRDGFVL